MFGWILSLLVLLHPQSAIQSFEVASIKQNLERGPAGGGMCHGIDSTGNGPIIAHTPLGHCVFTRILGYHLVTYAYYLENGPLPRNEMIRGVPDWFRTDIYDIDAKADDPSTVKQDELVQMLRELLSDRFKLKFHYEQKDADGFSLVEGRNGNKLEVAKDDQRRTAMVLPAKGGDRSSTKTAASFRELRVTKYSLYDLAIFLSGSAGGPVVDQTGLKQKYNFDLTWDIDAGPSLFTAVQEQLGLRLVPQKSPVKLLVVDSVERPKGN